jgi:hypothetical protein
MEQGTGAQSCRTIRSRAICATCHEGSTWHAIRKDFAFDHEKETGVPLVGAHSAAECLRCHNDRGPVAEFATQGCVGCHEDVHTGKLGKSCTDCHEQQNWQPGAEIVRHTRTRFPLVGSHTATPCFRCHAGADVGNFDRASVECVDCHRDQLALATNPDHQVQGWTTACDRCHIPTTWTGAGFNHFAFPLTGQHAVIACTACHVNNVFSGTPSACVACHQNDYNGANDPNHVALNFPTTCQNCHNTSNWNDAKFNHSGITSACVNCHQRDYNAANDPNHVTAGFSTACQDCHNTSDWNRANFKHTGITSGCVNCHQRDYNGATSPNHIALNYPTTCQSCHTTSTWTKVNFNHAGITRGCVTCHQRDYNSASPNHVSAGFPTTCNTCHTTTTWTGATFNHTQFPIASGHHHSLTCQQCHNTPNNFTAFTCTNCHEHLQPAMDKHHSRVSGYSYSSSACLNCHPNGSR